MSLQQRKMMHEILSRLSSTFPAVHRNLKVFIPLVRPNGNLSVHLYFLAALLTIVIGCAANIIVPVYSKLLVDSMILITSQNGTDSPSDVTSPFPWALILTLVFLTMVQGFGSLSLLNSAQSYIWMKIEQFIERNVQTKFFEHIQHLGVQWHCTKKTGDVLGALETGTESLTSILEHVTLCLVPTILDIVVAIIYISLHLSPTLGFSILIQLFTYLFITIYMTEERSKSQGPLNQAVNEQRHQVMESLYNFETVKYFTNEEYETQTFEKSISKVQRKRREINLSIISMNILQVVVMFSGYLMGMITVIGSIWWDGRMPSGRTYSVGDYILLTSYLSQLYGPLYYMGQYYRTLRTNLVDLECMLEMFEVEQQVVDTPNAKDIVVERGKIEFRNVSFGYSAKKRILKNISFSVQPRTCVALVGASGSGKSSILKLLLRFYDVDSGQILVDGQDVKDVKQKSLRMAMGVVPQDTTLFNNTLKHNIQYANWGAVDHEIISATQKSCLHQKILTFPDGYMTMVGERGVNLSGGERQRVGISRALVKDPLIVLLDEATSSLDVHTETRIVGSIRKLCENRTSLIITHRLGSIKHADEILVLKDGRIVERGTHEDLVLANGEYCSMWTEQTQKNGEETRDNS